MKVAALGTAIAIRDVPVGAIFGTFCSGEYARFLRAEGSNDRGQFPVVSLGPHFESEWTPGAPLGPTVYLWDGDTEVILEPNTALSIRNTDSHGHPIDPSEDSRVPLGGVVLTSDGKNCLVCRSGPGRRAWIDLATGKSVEQLRPVAHYLNYVLVGENELGKPRIIFDSANAQVSEAKKSA